MTERLNNNKTTMPNLTFSEMFHYCYKLVELQLKTPSLQNEHTVARRKDGEKVELRSLGWICIHTALFKMNETKTYFIANGTLLDVMWQP